MVVNFANAMIFENRYSMVCGLRPISRQAGALDSARDAKLARCCISYFKTSTTFHKIASMMLAFEASTTIDPSSSTKLLVIIWTTGYKCQGDFSMKILRILHKQSYKSSSTSRACKQLAKNANRISSLSPHSSIIVKVNLVGSPSILELWIDHPYE